MKLLHALRQFLKRRADCERPLVLALSGGADSLCLFYLLLECRSFFSEFHVVHIDHRWREESLDEAEWLRNLVGSFDVPFYLKSIDINKLTGNLEDASRNMRIEFLVEYARSVCAQAVLLGHHADDQAETVLKRVLEGAPLSKVSAIKPISCQKGVPFWRPLLNVPKKDIVQWMGEKGAQWLEDPTNGDTKYLRAKMRRRMIPWLSNEFGKNISLPLCHLGAELEEVEGYLQRQSAQYVPQKEKNGDLTVYDFAHAIPSDPLEWKTVVRMVCEQESFSLSRSQLHDIVRFLTNNSADKWIESAKKRVRVHLGRLIFSNRK